MKVRPRDIAAEKIENYILDNNLQPGDRLPAERKLCKDWSLSRATLHSVIHRLDDEGIVTSKVGSGTYVAFPRPTIKLQSAASFIDSVRDKGYEPGSIMIYARIEKASKHVMSKLSLIEDESVFTMCRVRLINKIPSAIEVTYVLAKNCRGIEAHDFSKESFYQVLRKNYGIVPLHGKVHLSITSITEEEATHLEAPEGSPAFYQSAVLSDKAGRPVEYFRSTVLPQRIHFSSERRWIQFDGDVNDGE